MNIIIAIVEFSVRAALSIIAMIFDIIFSAFD